MFVPVVRSGLQRIIQRVRKLPFPGDVLVNEGEQVYPTDVIAEAVQPTDIFMVDIARGLGVEDDELVNLLVRQPGEYLYEGDVIAQIAGTIPRLVRTPTDGQFFGLHRGNAVFEIGHKTVQVQAGMKGVVQAVLPEYGAVLSTSGLLMQGVWGNGAIDFGELSILEETWSQPLEAALLAEVGKQHVIAAGSCQNPQALSELVTCGSAGLVLFFLSPDLIPDAMALPIPVIVMQGFGMNQPDLSMLEEISPYSGQSVSLNACAVDHVTGARPEVIIPIESDAGETALYTREELRVGQKVRVISENGLAVGGKVIALPEDLSLFESGCWFPSAVVALNNGDAISVPQHNLIIQDDCETE